MVFVADDLGAWLVGFVADAGRKRLTVFVLGTDQERALRQAGSAAVKASAAELCPQDDERAQQLAMVVSQVFSAPVSDVSLAGQETLLEMLPVGIAQQLAPLDDASLTGTDQSSVDVLGIPAGVLTRTLARNVVREIVARGARGGPLEPLAAQLNHDLTHLQGQRLENVAGQLIAEVQHALARLDVGQSASVQEVRYALPPDTAAFTGRDNELGAVIAAAGGSVIAIRAFDGMPGVGKTALAVHVAHLLRPRFPDRQLFIDLHAHTPGQDPMTPEAALTGLLSAVGVDPSSLPDDVQVRAGVWRDRMVDQRALLILDNAASSAQVRPLLPGGRYCLVLITSRRHLGDLPGAITPLQLEALPPDQAQRMFLRLAPRAAEPPSAVQELCRLAGYLPLAISLLARVYARHPSWTLNDLEREAEASMLEVSAEEESVARAFDVSYRHVATEQQQFFRRLGLHPGTTVDGCSAAELAEVSLHESIDRLATLHSEGLLTEVSYRRYGMHDLIRRYVQDLAAKDPEPDRRTALARLARSCYGCVNYAFNVQNKGNPMVDAEFLADWTVTDPPGIRAVDEAGSPTAWFAAEQANLIAVTQAAQAAGLPITARLACSMFYFLEIGGHFDEWRQVEQIGKDTAVAPLDRAKSLRNRGRLAFVRAFEEQERLYDANDPRPSPAGASREAVPLLQESLSLYRQEGTNRAGEATVLRELADAYRLEAEPGKPTTVQRAVTAYQAAKDIYAELGNENGLASLRLALGITYARAHRYADAEPYLRAGLAYGEMLDDKGRAQHGRLKAYSLRRLAELYRDQGDLRQAVDYYQRCITASEVDVDDPIGRARALSYCAKVYSKLSEKDAARDCLIQAYKIFASRPLGDQDPEAKVVGAWLQRLDNG